MKILSIRIKNLASLAGEHFIDFESEPLASAGLIAIVGKTGAGKSTILDAMCLALFNRIPRLKDSDGKLTDIDGSELLTNSSLTVLRRGTGHGFAELSFIAQDQKVYLARWEIKRARENPNGKLQSVQRSIKCLTDGTVIADKAKAVELAVQRITQLSFEQFTRAVLLAQSEVTAFLKARDNERGELLEYLTNSSIFGKIGQLAYEKTKLIANQRKEIENALGYIELLSNEDATQYTEKLKQYNEQYRQLELEKQKLSLQQQWFEQQHKFEQNIQTRQAYLYDQQKQYEQLTEQRAQLAQLEIFSTIRSSIIQQQKLHIGITQITPKVQQSQLQFNDIEKNYGLEKSAFDIIDAEQNKQQQFEIQHQKNIELVRTRIQERRFLGEQLKKAEVAFVQLQTSLQPMQQNQAQLKNDLQQVHQLCQQQLQHLTQTEHFQPLDDGLSAHIAQLQRFIQSYKSVEQQFGNLSLLAQNVAEKNKQLTALEQQFGQSHNLAENIVSTRIQREHLLKVQSQFDVAHTQFQAYQQTQTESVNLKNTQEALKIQLEQSSAQQQSAEQHYKHTQNEREQLHRLLQQQRLLHTANIEKLREDLIDGEACLVCGSTHHPYIQDKSALSHELFQLQEQQEKQAIQLEKTAFETWQQLQQQYIKQAASFETNTARLNELNVQMQSTQNQLKQILQKVEVQLDFNQTSTEIEHVLKNSIEQSQQQLKTFDQTLDTLEQGQKRCYDLSQFIQQTTQQLAVVKQAEQNIQYMIDLLPELQKQNWTKQTLMIAEQLSTLLHNRQQFLQQADRFKEQIAQKTQQLEQLSQNIKFGQEKIQGIESDKLELTKKGKQNSDLAIQTIFEMTQLHVAKPHEWLAQFDQNRQDLQLQFSQKRIQFHKIQQSFDAAQNELNQYQTQLTQLQNQQNNLKLEIQQWLDQHPMFNEQQLEQLSEVSHEQEQQLKHHVKEVERTYADAQSVMKALQEQLQQHLHHKPDIEHSQLTVQMTAVAEQLQHLTEQRDDVKLKLDVHQRNLLQQKQFNDQIQKIQNEEHRWNKISSLMGDSTGKKFRDYAQQYNLDILIEYANQQLAMLSQRYTLKRLDNSLSLAIIDHDMDGETRSVASLSGGESFLTALALSLAIASMASGSMKIESLFIDEGFGTLDASSLYMVMNALDQLQSQGRKVVLISHIQEMHERIPVQIQVKPIGAGASTIEIVG